MGITAANLATMRPLLQAIITNATKFTSSLRTRKGDKTSRDISQKPSSHEQGTSTQAAGGRIAPNRDPKNVSDVALFNSAELQRSESNVNTWRSNSEEELVHTNEDIELSDTIYWKSEVAVTEENVK